MNDILSQNLIIALEPEAASLYCRTLGLCKFVGMAFDGKGGAMSIKSGDSYIIVDCGGTNVYMNCIIESLKTYHGLTKVCLPKNSF